MGWVQAPLGGQSCRGHEVAHVFRAVDHLARQPARPTAADAERMKALLSVEPSVELREMFDHWWARQHDFLDVTAQLEHIRKREAESDYQSELERDIETLRARRADLLHAAEEVRESAARDLDV